MPDTSYSYGVTPGSGSNREDLKGGRMKRRMPSVVAGARSSGLDTAMNDAAAQGGGISANAHPEFNKPTLFDNMSSFINKHFGTKHVDRPAPASAPLAPMDQATEDKLSKKYLGK